MCSSLTSLLAFHHIAKKATNIEDFQEFIDHAGLKEKEIFEGYKFFLKTIILFLLQNKFDPKVIEWNEDEILERAKIKGKNIRNVPNSCDMTIFLKNSFSISKKIWRSANWDSLKQNIADFKKKILNPLNALVEDLDKDKLETLTKKAMYDTFLFLNDTSYGTPKALLFVSLFLEAQKKRVKSDLKGYCVGLQFLWSKFLENHYETSELIKIDKVKTWKELDTFFGKIYETIIIPRNISEVDFESIDFGSKKVTRNMFKDVFSITVEKPEISDNEKFEIQLRWYPADVLDSKKMYSFNGTYAFIFLLLGLLNYQSELGWNPSADIIRFKHKLRKNQYRYSYGPLIRTGGGITDSSGWIIFPCVGNNFSGAGSRGWKICENVIKEQNKKFDLNTRDYSIEEKKFMQYLEKSHISDLSEKSRYFEDKIATGRGVFLELITYYILSLKKENKEIHWTGTEKDKIDIVYKNQKNEVYCIECKNSLNSLDLKNVEKKIKNKIKKTKKDPKYSHLFLNKTEIKTVFVFPEIRSDREEYKGGKIKEKKYKIWKLNEMLNWPEMHGKTDKIQNFLGMNKYNNCYD